MFRATMCPSSGVDDCVMLQPRVGMCRGCREVVKTGWQVVRPQDTIRREIKYTKSDIQLVFLIHIVFKNISFVFLQLLSFAFWALTFFIVALCISYSHLISTPINAHTYSFIFTSKHVKSLQHVSILRPSSGSYTVPY